MSKLLQGKLLVWTQAWAQSSGVEICVNNPFVLCGMTFPGIFVKSAKMKAENYTKQESHSLLQHIIN